jgi:hypothetical protein
MLSSRDFKWIAVGIFATGLAACAGSSNKAGEPGGGWQGTDASPKSDTAAPGAQDSGAHDAPNAAAPGAAAPNSKQPH